VIVYTSVYHLGMCINVTKTEILSKQYLGHSSNNFQI